MNAETRQRIEYTLDTLKAGDTLVVAVLDDRGAITHTIRPDARRLVDLATSLLDQALDQLCEDDADHDLAGVIEQAIEILPDRHADPINLATPT